MLDANLLTFFIADAKDGIKHHSTFYQTRGGAEPEPAYTLRHADPEATHSRNCYAAALFDSYIEDVLYGEVLLHPKWTQPSLSQEEIRRNGGVPPPPEPVMPTDFAIQLYNPDQQIQVTQKISALLGTMKWEFSMPQDTFRAPSSSILDKSQHDPGATITTPRINFVWKRESKFTKELTCWVTGKSTDLHGKKKHKEPDIAIALLKGLKEMTIYEPNLYRVDMEDPKGLEVVLLLSAAVIKDVFFGNIRQTFNVSDPNRKASSGSVSNSPGGDLYGKRTGLAGSSAAMNAVYQKPNSITPPADSQQPPPLPVRTGTAPPRIDPRTQWELDAETARLKAQAETEEREQQRQKEIHRKALERADAEEARRLNKQFEQEEKDRKAKQKQADKETQRLKRIFGSQQPQGLSGTPQLDNHQHVQPYNNAMVFSPGLNYGANPALGLAQPQPQQQQIYSAPIQQQPFHPFATMDNYNGYPAPPPQGRPAYNSYSGPPQNQHRPAGRRRSILGLRSLSDEHSNRLVKKTSSVW